MEWAYAARESDGTGSKADFIYQGNRSSQLAEMRDTFRDMDYWKHFLAFNRQTLCEYENASRNQEPVVMQSLRFWAFRLRLHLLIAAYSSGADLNELKCQFPPLLDAFQAHRPDPVYEGDSLGRLELYVRHLWLVSLAVLLEVPQEQMARTADLAAEPGRDALLDRLVSCGQFERLRGAPLLY